MKKTKLLMASVASVAALGVSGSAAAGGGGGGHGWTIVNIRTQPTDIVSTDYTPVCDAGGTCVYTQAVTSATQTGDLQGSTVEANAFGYAGSNVTGSGLGTFTGHVNGCGTGSFLYNAQRTIAADGTTDSTYVIVPGSGTGGLARITGVMKQHDAAGATSPAPVDGVYRCVAH
jgi:Protein of unknown function (DUF3224)